MRERGKVTRAADGPDGDAAVRPTLLYLLKQVELAVRARLDEMLRPDGLTALQYTALSVLEGHPDLTASQLARRSFVTAQSMADLVTALLDRGLVERHRDPADRRRLVLALTAGGRSVLTRFRPRVAALEAEMLRHLTGAEAGALRHALLECHRSLDEHSYAERTKLARNPVRGDRAVVGS